MKLIAEDIVISGVGGQFPNANNIEEFQKRLLNNENLIGVGWSEGLEAGFNKVGKISSGNFDHGFFKILQQQCATLDPMYMLAYERTFEALLDAGVNPVELSGRKIGCFIGAWIGESDNIFPPVFTNNHSLTGHSRNMLPNRISYWLNIIGPSYTIDSNYLSGLEMLKIAKESIENGHCEAAIVGATNLTMVSTIQKLFKEMNLLSPNGTQKAFDCEANGIVRGDAIVILYLQRLSEAKRSYASIVHIDSYYFGDHNESLTNLNIKSYKDFLNNFYKNLSVQPDEVDYVEAYGCGIKKVDEFEVEGLEQIYCKNRQNPLLIGSVKPSAGHSEAASALVSLVKVLISMEKGIIPATINSDNPNLNITAITNGKVNIATKNCEWDGQYAAVNCIGMGSAYGHILLKSNSKKKVQIMENLPRLVLVASRTEEGITNMLQMIEERIYDHEYITLIQEFHSKPTPLHTCRGYMIKGDDGFKKETQIYQGNKCQVWFVYSGMGSQWNGMVGDLMKIPVFAESINKSHNTLLSKNVNLKEIITTNNPTIFDNILNCFVGIAAIQIALTDVLKCLNIVPDGIIGHSVGELGCAYADGCLTAEEMILASYYRGRASLEATLIEGMMAAVGIGYNKIKNMLPPTIEVACHNSANSCTISGPKKDVEGFVQQLQNDGIFARLVNVANIAYHSQYIKPAAPILLKYLKQVLTKPVERSSKWISTSNPESQWNTDLAKYSSAEYHTNNLLSSVLFEEGFKHVPKDAILIEIAPHGLLQAILKRSCKQDCINVPLTQRGIAKNVEFLLAALGRLYLSGLNVNILKLYPDITYPVGKGTISLAGLAQWKHTFWNNNSGEVISLVVNLKASLNASKFVSTKNQKINNKFVVPLTAFLKIVLNLLSKTRHSEDLVVIEDLIFYEPFILSSYETIPFNAMLQKGTGRFEIVANDKLIVLGKFNFLTTNENVIITNGYLSKDKKATLLKKDDIYREFSRRGHTYLGPFKHLLSIKINKLNSVSIVEWNKDWTLIFEAMVQQQLLHDGETNQEVYLPQRINKIEIDFKTLSSNTTKLQINYDYLTNIISTLGINIIGMKTAHFSNDNIDIQMDVLSKKQYNCAVEYKIRDTDVNITYIGLNNDKALLSRYKGSDVIIVDYTGYNSKNEQIMGLASLNKNTREIIIDSILQWKVLSNFSPKSAITVPMAYACAYYCLVIKGKLKEGNRVLIHSAQSPIGMAAIAISLSYNCTVFATVESDQQKLLLKDNYSLLNENYIFNWSKENFQALIAHMTYGDLIDVVLNNLPGDFIETSMECLAHGGRFLHIGPITSSDIIGTSHFLLNTSFSVINLANICNYSNAIKEQVRNCVKDGIEQSLPRFEKHIICDTIDYENIYSDKNTIACSHLLKLHQKKLTTECFDLKNIKFACDEQMSYLILGGSSQECCNMAEWFVYRRARKLMLANEFASNDNLAKRRLNLLKSIYNADIDCSFANFNNIQTFQNVIQQQAPIDVVCVLSTTINIKDIRNLLNEKSPASKLLVFNSGSKIPGVLNFSYDTQLEFNQLSACLDKVLAYNIEDCFIGNSKRNLINENSPNKQTCVLPALNNILEEYIDASEEPELIQLTTNGIRNGREIPPVFIISSLGYRKEIELLSMKLTYPTWMAILPTCPTSLNQMANHLIKKMGEIYSGKVYNLIGISWGGPLMIEIANLLNKQDFKLNLYFINSEPNIIKSAVNSLGKNDQEIDMNLLSTLFKLDKEQLKQLSSLDEMLFFVENYSKTTDINLIRKIINNLKHLMVLIKEYHFVEPLIKGQVHLLCSNGDIQFDTCGLSTFCHQIPQVTSINASSNSIICHEETAQYILENHNVGQFDINLI